MDREQGAGNREQGAGSREQGAGSREQEAGNREQGSSVKEGEEDNFITVQCYTYLCCILYGTLQYCTLKGNTMMYSFVLY